MCAQDSCAVVADSCMLSKNKYMGKGLNVVLKCIEALQPKSEPLVGEDAMKKCPVIGRHHHGLVL